MSNPTYDDLVIHEAEENDKMTCSICDYIGIADRVSTCCHGGTDEVMVDVCPKCGGSMGDGGVKEDWLVELIEKQLPIGYGGSARKYTIARAIREELMRRIPEKETDIRCACEGFNECCDQMIERIK